MNEFLGIIGIMLAVLGTIATMSLLLASAIAATGPTPHWEAAAICAWVALGTAALALLGAAIVAVTEP